MAFVSAIELLYSHDRDECLVRLHEAKEKILEMINTCENIGDAGLQASVPQRDNDGDSPNDNDGDSPLDKSTVSLDRSRSIDPIKTKYYGVYRRR